MLSHVEARGLLGAKGSNSEPTDRPVTSISPVSGSPVIRLRERANLVPFPFLPHRAAASHHFEHAPATTCPDRQRRFGDFCGALRPANLVAATAEYRLRAFAVDGGFGGGRPWISGDGQPDPFPEGYPLLLAGLIRTGLGSTPWINTFNILCVLGSLLVFHSILKPVVDFPARIVLCLLPLASWVWIKHAAIPLSENAYLLLSMGALLLASRARLVPASFSWCWWLGALLLAVAAWHIRTVGLTLVAAVAVAAMIQPAVWCLANKQRRAVLAFAAALVLILGVLLARPWFFAASA